MTIQNVGEQNFQLFHERFGESRRAVIVEFDPDGTGIHVAAPRPGAGARVPSPLFLADHPKHRSVPSYQVVRGDFEFAAAEALKRRLRILHCSVVNYDQFNLIPGSSVPKA